MKNASVHDGEIGRRVDLGKRQEHDTKIIGDEKNGNGPRQTAKLGSPGYRKRQNGGKYQNQRRDAVASPGDLKSKRGMGEDVPRPGKPVVEEVQEDIYRARKQRKIREQAFEMGDKHPVEKSEQRGKGKNIPSQPEFRPGSCRIRRSGPHGRCLQKARKANGYPPSLPVWLLMDRFVRAVSVNHRTVDLTVVPAPAHDAQRSEQHQQTGGGGAVMRHTGNQFPGHAHAGGAGSRGYRRKINGTHDHAVA